MELTSLLRSCVQTATASEGLLTLCKGIALPRKGAVCGVARACKAPALLRTCALHTAPLRGNAIPLHSVNRPSLAVAV